MLDIKKNRGFQKIPQPSKLQPSTGAGSVSSSAAAAAEATAAAAASTGTRGAVGAATSGRGTASQSQRLKNQVRQAAGGGGAAAGASKPSVVVGKTHAALAAVKYGNGGVTPATQVRSTLAGVQGGATTTTATSNPVRAANQRYFLVSSYKDPTFLKAECELAHAQVTTTTASKVKGNRIRAGEDTRNNNNNSNSNNSSSNSSSGNGRRAANNPLSDMRRGHMFNGNQQTSTSTTTSHSTTISSNSNRITAGHQTNTNGLLHKYSSARSGTSPKVYGKLKPINTNNNTAAAAAAAAAMMNGHHHTNNNNNGSSGSSTATSGNNNMMQRQQQHDDITYIDSDEPTANGGGGGGAGGAGTAAAKAICYFKPITPPLQLRHRNQQQQQQDQKQSDSSHRYARPKSTIIASAHSNFAASYEKFSSGYHRQTNGGGGGGGEITATTESRSAAGGNVRRYGIDSLSIKASIEKFNNLSTQKRPTTNTATVSATGSGTGVAGAVGTAAVTGGRSNHTSHQQQQHTAGGSSGNLQQRYSSDLDNIRVAAAAGYSSSLTRAAYRTTATMNSVGTPMGMLETGAGATGVHASRQVASAESASQTQARSGTTGSSARSVLPPMTPTSSRYWDRDRESGTSRNSGSTSSTLTSSSLKHNSDEGYKNASSSRDEKSEGLCGLRNIGNTCFMNSVIQCLSHTQELTRFLRSQHGTRSSSTKDQQILHEFAKLIQEMWTPNVHTMTPMELKRAFSTKHRMYSDYNQQDAQEFLRFFLDSLHSALNTGVKGETLNIDDNLSDNKKADLTWEWYTRHENSLVRDLFVGQLKSTLKCTTCGNTSVTFDPFWDLSVPLPSSSRCKLEACLDLFIREEVLDGDEMPTCAKCKTRRKCTKSFTIQRFPKYLVIHLKRFSETRWSKLSNIVEFPTSDRELNMGSYGANSNSNVHYSLYAISNHMGSTAGGHYVALCKHPISRKWHEFNDNIVSDALCENHLVSSSAYILFYERA
ncbi:ubiquitin carboxyl-terminal hydrolase Usp2 isoform X2 [Drosophila kikkawai]|uniref:Ubiquitin carboxyl-terminal hydrolase n=1 Tax=Drosophila kikkawai TaxID=30033 RepID=A0A6P4J165_DROKI|nr:ubiquitin carboxyl-terminal hydrolase Usp2 isoform X2 [Drosophila kikkawai]